MPQAEQTSRGGAPDDMSSASLEMSHIVGLDAGRRLRRAWAEFGITGDRQTLVTALTQAKADGGEAR